MGRALEPGESLLFLQNFDQSRSPDECSRAVSAGVEGTLGGNSPWPFQN